MEEVCKKILRGCEFKLASGRHVEPPYTLDVYSAHTADIAEILNLFQQFGPTHLGPGFQVRRAPTKEDSNSVL